MTCPRAPHNKERTARVHDGHVTPIRNVYRNELYFAAASALARLYLEEKGEVRNARAAVDRALSLQKPDERADDRCAFEPADEGCRASADAVKALCLLRTRSGGAVGGARGCPNRRVDLGRGA